MATQYNLGNEDGDGACDGDGDGDEMVLAMEAVASAGIPQGRDSKGSAIQNHQSMGLYPHMITNCQSQSTSPNLTKSGVGFGDGGDTISRIGWRH